MMENNTNRPKSPKEWGNIYQEKLTFYEGFAHKLRELVTELIHKQDIEVAHIEARTKSVESFVEKIGREGKDYSNPLNEITDLVGIRVITYYREDIDKIGKIIREEFDIDWENSVDPSQVLEPDTFGYLSIHYVVSLLETRSELPEWEGYRNLKAEIQVRTVLQHAWAEIEHTLLYKTPQEIPNDLRRQLFRLSALLELADEQFSAIQQIIKRNTE
jgi:ppGpp synthetase/RelA/SpoT-type nucleotidyltranferase